MKTPYSMCLLAAAMVLLGCASANKPMPATDYPQLYTLASSKSFASTTTGYCDVGTGSGMLRMLVQIEMNGDTVMVGAIDELGVPLAQIVTSRNEVNVLRTIPPMKRSPATKMALNLRAYVLAMYREFSIDGAYEGHVGAGFQMTVWTTSGEPDSLIIAEGTKARYRGLFEKNSFRVNAVGSLETLLEFFPR